jgi:hypothetical protein
VDLNYVFTNLVDKNYTFGNVKNTFKRNVFPVSFDGIKYNGVTKPSLVTSRQSGQPRTKRIRRRSEFLAAEDSPIVCSNCGCRGHNRQSCNAPAQQRTNLLTNLSLQKELGMKQNVVCNHWVIHCRFVCRPYIKLKKLSNQSWSQLYCV